MMLIDEFVNYTYILIIIMFGLFFDSYFFILTCFFVTLQAAGKYRQQGRNYIVEDGDIIFFKFNTPNAPKKKWESVCLHKWLYC